MVSARVATLAAASVLAASACKPELAGRPSTVDKDVILAIRSFPAEVNPADMPPHVVTYQALYAGPNGAPDPSTLDWAFCDQPKPLALTGPISPACLVRRAPDITTTVASAADGGAPTTETRHILTPFGTGLTAKSAVPNDGCRVFGPFPPEPLHGESAARPADPDTTGGFYQPVRLLVPSSGHDEYAVGVTRLGCGLVGATPEQSAEFTKKYLPNENPAIASLAMKRAKGVTETLSAEPGSPVGTVPKDGGATDATTLSDAGDAAAPSDAGDSATSSDSGPRSSDSGAPPNADTGAPKGPPITVSPGEHVTFVAKWADCPGACSGSSCPSVKPCSGSEAYQNLDVVQHQLLDHRESIRVSWFSSDGTFDHDRTGRAEAEAAAPETENAWTAPSSASDVHVWVVIRDDRGGVGWSTYLVHVTP